MRHLLHKFPCLDPESTSVIELGSSLRGPREKGKEKGDDYKSEGSERFIRQNLRELLLLDLEQ